MFKRINMNQLALPLGQPTCLDLFAGAGGSSLGLEAAGFNVIGAVEFDPVAAKTLEENFGKRPLDRLGPEQGDIKHISPRELHDDLRKAGIMELDLLVATPPCQGFSKVGRGKLNSLAERGKQFLDDERNSLYRSAVEVLAELRPRAFLFENVPGMLHMSGVNVAEAVCAAIREMGYVVRCAVLNAAWYGVPQTRERLIIVGFRSDLGIIPTFPARQHDATLWRGNLGQSRSGAGSWEEPEFFVPFNALPMRDLMLPAVTAAEAFDGLPPFKGHLEALQTGKKYRTLRNDFPDVDYTSSSLNEYGRLMRDWRGLGRDQRVTEHYCRWTPRDFETFRRMAPGDRYPEALEIARKRYEEALLAHKDGKGERPLREDFVPPYPDDSFEDKWRKLDPRHPSWTVTAHLARDTYSHIHFDADQARAITVREAARLQSFPDGFRFAGNTGEMYRQIGNAVPPLLGLALGEAILEQLEAVDRASRARGEQEWNTADPQQSVMMR